MTKAVAELLEASKSLSVEDRLALADAIWETILIDDDWRPSPAVLAELDRRRAEHLADPGSALTSEEVWSRLNALRTA